MFVQGNRWMSISWFYKQFDTSLKCKDPNTGKQTLPMELDPRMLFKANGTDNKKYSTDLRVDTIGRQAPLCPSCVQIDYVDRQGLVTWARCSALVAGHTISLNFCTLMVCNICNPRYDIGSMRYEDVLLGQAVSCCTCTGSQACMGDLLPTTCPDPSLGQDIERSIIIEAWPCLHTCRG